MPRIAKSFFLPFLAPIPLILYALLPEIADWDPAVELGETANVIIWIILVGFVIVMSFLPFKGAFGAFFGTKESKRIQRLGREATGVVQAIGENSQGGIVTINDQPLLNLQLEVHDGDAPPYPVSFDTVIPRAAVPQFQPGAVIPIKIDPDDPQKVIVDWQRGSSGEAPEAPSVGAKWSEADKRLVETEGIDGTAKYLALEDTGRSQDFNPIVRATIEVTPKGGETYTFDKDVPLPTNVIGIIRSKIGQSFPARIHPNDGTKVSIHIT
jgi:hypothetical protein